MSVNQKIEAVNRRRYAGAASLLSGDNYIDGALWQLSLILAEIATSRPHSAEDPVVLDEEPEDGNEGDMPDE